MTEASKLDKSKNTTNSAEGSMYLYDQPEYLSREAHETLGWSMPEAPYAFAKGVSSIPLVVTEIPSAQKYYPIVFSGKENGQPLAILSTVSGDNVFVSDGIWEKDYYIPAYLRRHPFATVQGEGNKVAVVIDRGSEGIVENSDLPFFKDGNISKDTQSMIDFSVQYEHDRSTTQNFMKTMLSLDLLSEQHVGHSVDGEDRTFANFISIDGEKFNALSPEHLASLHEQGYLAFIYGQLFSQEHWGKLISRIPPSAS
tara:strand:- start:856 stop:1620 length:765 start_codon:yes stop_codon:yes gene_type:complete